MRACCWAVFALAATTACSDQPVSVEGRSPALRTTTAGRPPGDYVATPAGWFHRSCVYEVEDGAWLKEGHIVTRRDGTTFSIPVCAYPAYPNLGPTAAERTGAPFPPSDTGWIEYAYFNLPRGNWYQRLTANWPVPQNPTGGHPDSALYYTFPGLSSNWFINQPVISYGYSGPYWQMASWHCDGEDGTCIHSTIKTISSGDAMHGEVYNDPEDCHDGVCTWIILTQDLTRGDFTLLLVDDTQDYWRAEGGAVEVYGLTSCSQYPRNGVFYYRIFSD